MLDQETAEQAQPHEESKRNYAWLKFLIDCLFWFGIPASALQGFFSINSFIQSLGAIPGMAFLYLIPYAFILVSAVIIALYSVVVEQQIFREYFERLVAQLLGIPYEEIFNKDSKDSKDSNAAKNKKTEDNSTYNERTHALINKTKALSSHHANIIDTDDTNEQISQDKYNLHWMLQLGHTIFAYSAACFIVGLRALVSIGSTMLGTQVLIGLLLAPLGLTSPLWIIPVCAVMSAVGYFIKTSQNIVDQFNETLKILGLNRYVKTDFKKAKKKYKQTLKTFYTASTTTDSNNNKQDRVKPELPLWSTIVCRIMDIGFVFGAVGASMQGFFSIQKFVSQMGSVPFLYFFNAIPATFIISCACIIAVYTLFVEQKILYQYFHSLVLSWFQPESNEDLYYVDYDNEPDPHTDYKLQILEKDVDYQIKQITIEGSIKYRISFKSKEAYKVYRYNQKIDQIYGHSVLSNTGEKRAENKKDNQLPREKDKIEYNYLLVVFARIGTVFILLLRAITSIGPSVLGLVNVVNLVTSLVGIASLGAWVFLPCIIMAAFGYMIKCSQNIHNHYHNTMRDIFGIDEEQSTYQDKSKLINKLNDEYIETLELFNTCKNDNPSSPNQANNDQNPPSPRTVQRVLNHLRQTTTADTQIAETDYTVDGTANRI